MLRIFVDPFDGKVTTYYKRLEKNTLKLPIARYSNELRECRMKDRRYNGKSLIMDIWLKTLGYVYIILSS